MAKGYTWNQPGLGANRKQVNDRPPDGRCVICGAKLRSGNLKKQCDCHSIKDRHQNGTWIPGSGYAAKGRDYR